MTAQAKKLAPRDNGAPEYTCRTSTPHGQELREVEGTEKIKPESSSTWPRTETQSTPSGRAPPDLERRHRPEDMRHRGQVLRRVSLGSPAAPTSSSRWQKEANIKPPDRRRPEDPQVPDRRHGGLDLEHHSHARMDALQPPRGPMRLDRSRR